MSIYNIDRRGEKLPRREDTQAAVSLEQCHQQMSKGYLPGTGWCWMQDGEIIEVIDDDPLSPVPLAR